MPLVYKLTFSNGKIYVGSDITDCASYFGSPSPKQIELDYPVKTGATITLTKEILWHDPSASKSETLKQEREMIVRLRANDPTLGYNLKPRFISEK